MSLQFAEVKSNLNVATVLWDVHVSVSVGQVLLTLWEPDVQPAWMT